VTVERRERWKRIAFRVLGGRVSGTNNEHQATRVVSIVMIAEGERSIDRGLTQLEPLQRMRLGQPLRPKLEVSHTIS
jgi:hypothetical protein